MLREWFVVSDFVLCWDPQKFGPRYHWQLWGNQNSPREPKCLLIGLVGLSIGVFPVFNPKKNGAKTLIVFLCLLHVIHSSFFFLSPTKTGVVLFRLRINRTFEGRIGENFRDDSSHFHPFQRVETCRQFSYTCLFNFVLLRVLKHGFQWCSDGTVSQLVPKLGLTIRW